MAVSIKDVARAVGVSAGTVSRAFNDYSDIKEETKQQILAAAKELGLVGDGADTAGPGKK